MHHSQARTDFSQFSHQQLIAMLAAGDPATIRAAAAGWDSTGRLLHDQAQTLQQQLTGFDDKWQGQAAQQYQRMITDLSGGLRTVADTAWAVRDAAYDAADALDTARAAMPAPQAVPDVSPGTVALAAAPLQFDGLSQPQASQLIQQQTAAAAAVRDQQQAQAVADAAHAQAVQVMTTLADHYTSDDAAIPEVPDAGTAPAVDPNAVDQPIGSPAAVGPTGLGPSVLPADAVADGGAGDPGGVAADPATGTHAVAGTSGLPGAVPPAATTTNPLFGNMFREGIAAAGAAFPLSRVPALIRRSKTDPAKRKNPNLPAPATAAGAAAAGSKLSGALPGAGGGAGIGGGAGGSALSAADAPAAYAGLAGSSSAPGTGMAAAGLAGAVGGAASANPTGGFMGGVPMGAGMGGMGMDGGGRRIPPWLVETEDVWGESSAVSPTVIGEEL